MKGDGRHSTYTPVSGWPQPWRSNPRSWPKCNVRAAPMECGHEFRSEIPPSTGERVWCRSCDDYRRAE
ncbi:hypothetical protein [Paractinoplanes durhamensis]|uniref:Uncharacterized protein n=1 Tax=Paractinoplanes durhamensis TaxID=113563 RepID=A0ABQ3ZBS4_9ACTN|nr:hypothetical protein [Actinoplanes durhamensis]GIE07298.1 hypothetical protein Adu01nite_86480 [Actinoplanes durhamensis]